MMKKYSLFCLLILLVIALAACNRPAKNFSDAMLDKYQGQPGFFHVKIPPGLMQLVFNGEQGKEMTELFRDVNQVGIMVMSRQLSVENEILQAEVAEQLRNFNYDDLFTVAESGSILSFKVLEKNGQLNELMAMVSDEEGIILVSLYGKMEMGQIMSMAGKLSPEVLQSFADIRSRE
jgi:hypothetical protein